MTLKEATLKSLDEINKVTSYSNVLAHILANNYYDFKDGKTPGSTVSSILGDFIRNGDTRVKRIKQSGGTFSYYLTKNEHHIDLESLVQEEIEQGKNKVKVKNYEERDLHILLSSFLKNTETYAKTIFHEQSLNSRDNTQKWVHPDMVGIKFLSLKSTVSQNFFKTINKNDTFKISSYEVKREINSDYELKKCYFQAVSNSSWANLGYLVAFEISDTLTEEMERLNQSFGIGIIELKANPYESKILFPAREHQLDFKTIDKLCRINKDFEKFIEQTENLMTASDKYYKSTEKELNEFCDKYLATDTEFETYCQTKFIPFDKKVD